MDSEIAQNMNDVDKAIAVVIKNMDENLLDIKSNMEVALGNILDNVSKYCEKALLPALEEVSFIEKEIVNSRVRLEEHMTEINTHFLNEIRVIQSEMAEKYNMKIKFTGAPIGIPINKADTEEDKQIFVLECGTTRIERVGESKGMKSEIAEGRVEIPSKRTDAEKDIQSKPTEIGEGSKTVESKGGAQSKMVDKQKGMKSESAVPQVGIPMKKAGVEEDTGNKSTGIRAESITVQPQTGARSKIPDKKTRTKSGRR